MNSPSTGYKYSCSGYAPLAGFEASSFGRFSDVYRGPAACAQFAALALTAVAACANRKHRAAAWLTTVAWPKALNMTVRLLTHEHTGARDDRQPHGVCGAGGCCLPPPGKNVRELRFQMIDNNTELLVEYPALSHDARAHNIASVGVSAAVAGRSTDLDYLWGNRPMGKYRLRG
jgi:hypothetical protein